MRSVPITAGSTKILPRRNGQPGPWHRNRPLYSGAPSPFGGPGRSRVCATRLPVRLSLSRIVPRHVTRGSRAATGAAAVRTRVSMAAPIRANPATFIVTPVYHTLNQDITRISTIVVSRGDDDD